MTAVSCFFSCLACLVQTTQALVHTRTFGPNYDASLVWSLGNNEPTYGLLHEFDSFAQRNFIEPSHGAASFRQRIDGRWCLMLLNLLPVFLNDVHDDTMVLVLLQAANNHDAHDAFDAANANGNTASMYGVLARLLLTHAKL